MECKICNSNDLQILNTYKYKVYVCRSCNSSFYLKPKNKFLFERIFPSFIARKLLPKKAFARLFRLQSRKEDRENFYNVYLGMLNKKNFIKDSEYKQLLDNLKLANINLKDKTILDISGGPGIIVNKLTKDNFNVDFTEINPEVVNYISISTGAKGFSFDYYTDNLIKKTNKKYDLILIRSSIVFHPNLNDFVLQCKSILNQNGHIFIETIVPSFGEIFIWQQCEIYFPRIYSEQAINNVFYKNNFIKKLNHRISGHYIPIKYRGKKCSPLKFIFTFFIDIPMAYIYRFNNVFKNTPIDQSMRHKNLTQVWQLNSFQDKENCKELKDVIDSKEYSSTHFSRRYNGYLKKENLLL